MGWTNRHVNKERREAIGKDSGDTVQVVLDERIDRPSWQPN
jgi:hypothetical protein